MWNPSTIAYIFSISISSGSLVVLLICVVYSSLLTTLISVASFFLLVYVVVPFFLLEMRVYLDSSPSLISCSEISSITLYSNFWLVLRSLGL
jgi:hypothetical protein